MSAVDRRSPALITVSGTIPPDLTAEVGAGTRPRPDYVALATALGGDLLDHAGARRQCGKFGRLLERFVGVNALLAWATYRASGRYEAVLTDGEQVGLPYAALCWLSPARRRPRHTMIVHIMSVNKKVLLFKVLRLRRRIDAFIVYATSQRDFAVDELRMPRDAVHLSSFTVDGAFFAPHAVEHRPRPMICSAGLELRDYETLLEAVRGLELDIVIAAASPWSKRASTIDDAPLPPNVTVTKLGFVDLRKLYADASFVVMPLRETPFQAGITTILEAMAMSKAVVCSRTAGQTDTIVDGVTGVYVPPGDPDALRAALVRLVDDPAEATRIGGAARNWIESTADLDVYAARLASVVRPSR